MATIISSRAACRTNRGRPAGGKRSRAARRRAYTAIASLKQGSVRACMAGSGCGRSFKWGFAGVERVRNAKKPKANPGLFVLPAGA
jgi:hypothetical protein